MDTLLLDTVAWDLVLDASGNIAVASDPYSMAQDAASAIKVFLGECYWDTELGLPYLTQIFGHNPPLGLLKALFNAEAETVPGVVSPQCFMAGLSSRIATGQVQITSEETGDTAAANFTVSNPQG